MRYAGHMQSGTGQAILGAIFDVDGVLVDSPHEQAWRAALAGFADPARFTPAFYQAEVAGRPRLDGARATLAALAPPADDGRVARYAAAKQARIVELIAAGQFTAFPDAVRLAGRLHAAGLRLALASSSRNADAMLDRLTDGGGGALRALFHADLCGIDLAHGKPDPEIFLRAAAALGLAPAACLVVEDAPSGILAARAGGMAALGIARRQDGEGLVAAGAGLVLTLLDDLDVPALSAGQLRTRETRGP